MINTWVLIELFLFESAQVRTLQRNNNTRISKKRAREEEKGNTSKKSMCQNTSHHIHVTRNTGRAVGVVCT